VRGRVTAGLALLRTTGLGALVLLLWNPTTSSFAPGASAVPPLVLLDASLSMAGHGGRWHEALDTARALAQGGGVIWRFGSQVRAFDSLPPGDGATRLAPALAAAAGREGPVAVVTDGAIADVADLPSDLLARARVIVLPRPALFDAFVSDIAGPRRIGQGDTVRLRVSYGTTGKTAGEGGTLKDARSGGGKGTLVVRLGSRRLTSRVVSIPDSGILSTEVTLPPSPFPGSLPAGWQALEVRLEGVAGDSEPRDDARWLVLEVSPPPSVVLLAAPPDWDSRFLARTLSDVARVPVRTLVQSGSDGSGWRDAAGLTPVSAAAAAQAVAGARLVVRMGDPAALDRFPTKGAVLTWPTQRGQDGDWYVRAPEPSPLAGALAGVAWDSLPPAAAVSDLALPPTGDSAAVVVLTARLARRGAARPVIVLSQPGGARRAAVAASGLFRWAFRGGASAEAYRAVVAALADWLLTGGDGRWEKFVPVMRRTRSSR